MWRWPVGLVGLDAALDLAHVRELGRLAAGTRDARLAVDRHRCVEQPGLGERRQRERRGRGVAAGIGDLARVEHVLAEQLREAVGPIGIEPEVGAEVDDGRACARDRLAERAARTVRQAEERNVAARERPPARARRSPRSAPGPSAATAADVRRAVAQARDPRSPRRPRCPRSASPRRRQGCEGCVRRRRHDCMIIQVCCKIMQRPETAGRARGRGSRCRRSGSAATPRA